ncbi:uncharacterized protein ACO6RY_03458 [Pungitius sinensis]
MPPLFMESGLELNSPGSVSGASNTAGSEREGGRRVGSRGRIRQENNRTAARKSRRKQTERADELHEELQCMERANSAIRKEIAALKKDLHLYTTALERHKPFCCLRDSASNPTGRPAVPHCSPPGGPSRAPRCALTAGPSLSHSLTSRLGLQSRDCVESAHLSCVNPPPPRSTALAAGPPGSVTASSSAPFSGGSPFDGDPPPAISSRPRNVAPVRTGPGSPLRSGGAQASSLTPADAPFSALHPAALDEFLSTQASFLPAPSRGVPLDPRYPPIASQLCPDPFGDDSGTSSASCSLLPPTLRDPSPLSLSRAPPPSALTMEPSYGQPATLNCGPLLSMLTVPSALHVPQTTSSSFHEPRPQNPASLPLLGDTSRDLSLSELLEVNDWILSGSIH